MPNTSRKYGTRYGVKRGCCVTSFGKRLDAALTYWEKTHGSVLVYQVNGMFGTGIRQYRWLHVKLWSAELLPLAIQ